MGNVILWDYLSEPLIEVDFSDSTENMLGVCGVGVVNWAWGGGMPSEKGFYF